MQQSPNADRPGATYRRWLAFRQNSEDTCDATLRVFRRRNILSSGGDATTFMPVPRTGSGSDQATVIHCRVGGVTRGIAPSRNSNDHRQNTLGNHGRPGIAVPPF
jgi:hypothetical protein